jgi:Mrp family chromosome partitioning ATPase
MKRNGNDGSGISIVPDPTDEAGIEDAEIYEGNAATAATLHEPRALPTERYRMIALRLLDKLGDGRSDGRVVIVSSPSRGDGKTTTAIHLAATLARDLGRRVCAIDCDLARPRLHRPLGLSVRRGLADVLRGDASLDQIIWKIGDDPLWIVPGAPADDIPASFAGLARVIDEARARHDIVLLDTPATSESADAAALGRSADGVLLVVRAGATTRDALAGAIEALAGVTLVGCVLNGHDGPIATARSLRATTALALRPRTGSAE